MSSTGHEQQVESVADSRSVNIDSSHSVALEQAVNKSSKCRRITSAVLSFAGYVVLAFDMVLLVCLLTLLIPQIKERCIKVLGRGYPTPSGWPDCSFSLQTLIDKMDQFMLHHLLLHMFLTMAIRNRMFNWISSIIWEILENIYCLTPAFGYTC